MAKFLVLFKSGHRATIEADEFDGAGWITFKRAGGGRVGAARGEEVELVVRADAGEISSGQG